MKQYKYQAGCQKGKGGCALPKYIIFEVGCQKGKGGCSFGGKRKQKAFIII